MQNPLWPTLISAGAIVLGAIVSGYIATRTTRRNIDNQYKLQRANITYQEIYKRRDFKNCANIVRLDLCTAIFEAIRAIQNIEKNSYLYILPLSPNYHKAVTALSEKLTLKELSYIYQLYGIIEKVNSDILKSDFNNKDQEKLILLGFEAIIKKVFGENYSIVYKLDIDNISYKDLYNNEFIKFGYLEVLSKLDELCHREK